MGKHSYRDMGVKLASIGTIGYPDKVKNVQRVPFSNVEYDFSYLYGEQVFTNRTLSYTFNIGKDARTYERMNQEKVKIANWLMGARGKQPLYDDTMRGWHFMAEVESDVSFQADLKRGFLTVTFNAYPFMIRNSSENSDIWDDFNFEYDISQPLSISVDEGTFKKLLNGTYVTVGAYATYFDGWDKISKEKVGLKRMVKSSVATTQGYSKRAYVLEGVEGLVLEQDIPQSRIAPNEITIINNGTISVSPKIVTTNSVSIEHEGNVYNFSKGTHKDGLLRLQPGKNVLKLTAIRPTTVDFSFFKELI